jgi:hypothetical protein
MRKNVSDYLKNKEIAREFVTRRVQFFTSLYGYKANRIFVRNQRTRWGSCSRKGNLNFNFRLVHLPQELADYVVVHEICHLKEFNHSKNYWALVEMTLPNYKELREKLKRYRF